MSHSYRCGDCGSQFSTPASWSSGGPEYRCNSCSLKAKRSYEASVRKYEASSRAGGSGCAVVAFLILAAPVVTATVLIVMS